MYSCYCCWWLRSAWCPHGDCLCGNSQWPVLAGGGGLWPSNNILVFSSGQLPHLKQDHKNNRLTNITCNKKFQISKIVHVMCWSSQKWKEKHVFRICGPRLIVHRGEHQVCRALFLVISIFLLQTSCTLLVCTCVVHSEQTRILLHVFQVLEIGCWSSVDDLSNHSGIPNMRVLWYSLVLFIVNNSLFPSTAQSNLQLYGDWHPSFLCQGCDFYCAFFSTQNSSLWAQEIQNRLDFLVQEQILQVLRWISITVQSRPKNTNQSEDSRHQSSAKSLDTKFWTINLHMQTKKKNPWKLNRNVLNSLHWTVNSDF